MKKIALSFMSIAMLSGCATTGMFSKTGGSLVTIVKEGDAVTSNAGTSKRGEACSQNILGIVSTGDSSFEAAKKAGNITKVASIDTDYMNVLHLYGKVCTIVTGD